MPHVNAVCTNFSQKIIAFARVSKFNSQSENHYGKIYNSSIFLLCLGNECALRERLVMK